MFWQEILIQAKGKNLPNHLRSGMILGLLVEALNFVLVDDSKNMNVGL